MFKENRENRIPAVEKQAEKEKKWRELVEKIESIGREENLPFEKPVDRKIKSVIIGLNALEINTVESCQGHREEKTLPYVGIMAPNEPERFTREREIAEGIKQKYDFTPAEEKIYWEVSRDKELLKRIHQSQSELGEKRQELENKHKRKKPEAGELKEWWQEKTDRMARETLESKLKDFPGVSASFKRYQLFKQLGGEIQTAILQARERGELTKETPEFLKWRKENAKLRQRVEELKDEFEKEKDIHLVIKTGKKELKRESPFAITTQKGDLTTRQKEMQNFGKFLRDKFFAEE